MDPFKKSFKSQSSYNTRHGRCVSSSGGGAPIAGASSTSHEELPILSHIQHQLEGSDSPPCSSPTDADTHQSPRTSGTGASSSSRVSRDTSVEFWRPSGEAEPETPQDPPSRLIGDFLQKQGQCGGEVALDMDLEMMEELRSVRSPRTAVSTTGSGRLCQDSSSELLRASFEHLISGKNSASDSSEDNSRCSGK